jgi:hypothetical protein
MAIKNIYEPTLALKGWFHPNLTIDGWFSMDFTTAPAVGTLNYYTGGIAAAQRLTRGLKV